MSLGHHAEARPSGRGSGWRVGGDEALRQGRPKGAVSRGLWVTVAMLRSRLGASEGFELRGDLV